VNLNLWFGWSHHLFFSTLIITGNGAIIWKNCEKEKNLVNTKFWTPEYTNFFSSTWFFFKSFIGHFDLQYCEYLSILQKSFNPHSHVKREIPYHLFEIFFNFSHLKFLSILMFTNEWRGKLEKKLKKLLSFKKIQQNNHAAF